MTPSDNILVYASLASDQGYRVRTLVEQAVTEESIIIVKNVDQLYRTLRKPMNGIVAAVLMVGSGEELVRMVNIRELLLRIPLILVLPDQKADTVTHGHALRPRYLTYADSDLSVVPDVFRKIVGRATTCH